MTSRRDFLHSAAVLSAAPLASGTALGAEDAKPRIENAIPDIAAAGFSAVFDARFPASRAFGERARGLGALTGGFDGDVTHLWRTELLARWKAKPALTVGLTDRHALFVLERLAWDQGMRVVFEAEHQPASGDRALHRIVRAGRGDLDASLSSAADRWAETLADHLLADPQLASADVSPTGAAMASHLAEPSKLHSWIIAPRNAA